MAAMPVVPGEQRRRIGRVVHMRRLALLSDRCPCYLMIDCDVTEPNAVNKPRPVRKLAELTSEFLADAFKKQGFAATELVTRWKDIVGPTSPPMPSRSSCNGRARSMASRPSPPRWCCASRGRCPSKSSISPR